jgi:hypothetical protein
MQLNNSTMIAALGAVLIAAAPAFASADTTYFLVGTHHVFRIGPNPYALVDERRQIEQKFADDLAAAQSTHDEHIAAGADPAKESDDFGAYLADLEARRDSDLGALYPNADDIRISHPELQIEGEGPYQVMGIHFHWNREVMVFDTYTVCAPWYGYVAVGAPYGWAYGVAYSPFELHRVYLGWHDRYFVPGRPAFYGFVGVRGAVNIGINVGIGGGFAIGRQPLRHDPWGHDPYRHDPIRREYRPDPIRHDPIRRDYHPDPIRHDPIRHDNHSDPVRHDPIRAEPRRNADDHKPEPRKTR